jgi:hypothetical protein
MNKHINFEDTIFILNVRLRMVRDLLKLDTDPGLFLRKTVDDLEFVDHVLEGILANLLANPRLLDRDLEFDNLGDLEWQFGQILAEFTEASTGCSLSADYSPEIRDRVSRLRSGSAVRRKTIDETFSGGEQPGGEPVVSSAELSELLRGR